MEGWYVMVVLVSLCMLRDRLRRPMKMKISRYHVRWEQGVLDAVLAGDFDKAEVRRGRREYWNKLRIKHDIY